MAISRYRLLARMATTPQARALSSKMTIRLRFPRLSRAWIHASGNCQNSPAEASRKRPSGLRKMLVDKQYSEIRAAPMRFFPVNSPAGREKTGIFTVLLAAWVMLALPASLLAHEAGGDKRLPVIGPAPPFRLTSQDGGAVALADYRGKGVALTFIYTQCPDICPLLTQKMVDVQDALGAEFGGKIAFLSITLDPEARTAA